MCPCLSRHCTSLVNPDSTILFFLSFVEKTRTLIELIGIEGIIGIECVMTDHCSASVQAAREAARLFKFKVQNKHE